VVALPVDVEEPSLPAPVDAPPAVELPSAVDVLSVVAPVVDVPSLPLVFVPVVEVPSMVEVPSVVVPVVDVPSLPLVVVPVVEVPSVVEVLSVVVSAEEVPSLVVVSARPLSPEVLSVDDASVVVSPRPVVSARARPSPATHAMTATSRTTSASRGMLRATLSTCPGAGLPPLVVCVCVPSVGRVSPASRSRPLPGRRTDKRRT